MRKFKTNALCLRWLTSIIAVILAGRFVDRQSGQCEQRITGNLDGESLEDTRRPTSRDLNSKFRKLKMANASISSSLGIY